MKYEVKKLSDYDIAMIGSIYSLTELDMMGVMMDKGDIELPNINKPPIIVTIGEEFDDSFELPKGKFMKAADRRKRTYHKHQQRERKYRNLGYPLERFSEADLGKMKEGVGMFPETQHQYTLYNRGEKKGEKPITTKQAISMWEHEKWLDEQEVIAEYEKAEWLMVADNVDGMKQDVCWLNNQLEYANARLRQMMESIKELNDSISSIRQEKERLIERIMKEEDWLEAHKK